jgi:hypothetical protein
VIVADLSKHAPHNSYGPPEYYVDQTLKCRDCGKEFTWTAKRQQYWFEVLKIPIHVQAVRCAAIPVQDLDVMVRGERLILLFIWEAPTGPGLLRIRPWATTRSRRTCWRTRCNWEAGCSRRSTGRRRQGAGNRRSPNEGS